jgi:hypothetical protein
MLAGFAIDRDDEANEVVDDDGDDVADVLQRHGPLPQHDFKGGEDNSCPDHR